MTNSLTAWCASASIPKIGPETAKRTTPTAGRGESDRRWVSQRLNPSYALQGANFDTSGNGSGVAIFTWRLFEPQMRGVDNIGSSLKLASDWSPQRYP
jgi:hypothetical protein